jgi:hypothetical protein
LQEFVFVTQEDVAAITAMEWPTKEVFELNLCARAQSRSTLIVPHLFGSCGYDCLRLKILSEPEYNVMNKEYTSMCDREQNPLERVESLCENLVYFFGSENSDLSLAPGKLMSYWGRDPRVTKYQTNYCFAVALMNAHGQGFGCRHSVACIGLNLYLKDCGTGSVRPHPSPLQAGEDVDIPAALAASRLPHYWISYGPH